MARIRQWLKVQDAVLHAYFMERYPAAMPRVDKIAGAIFYVLSNGAFAVILALVLSALADADKISAIRASYLVIAWFTAFLWIARATQVRALTVVSRLIVCVLCGIVLSVTALAIVEWNAKSYLDISPQFVTFDPSRSNNQNFAFTVTNTTSYNLYAVEAKLTIRPASLSYRDFTFRVPSSSVKPFQDNSPFTDLNGLVGRDNERNTVVFLWIWRLTPHETRELDVTYLGEAKATATASIGHLTTEPVGRGSDLNRIDNEMYVDAPTVVVTPFVILQDGSILVRYPDSK
jgi:hypothetical protein